MSDPASITLSLIEALTKAAKQFRFYELQHMAKGNLDGDAKARTNCEFAEMCEAALQPARAQTAGDVDELDGLPIERENMLAERQRLLDRKFAGDMTQAEAQRLAFIRYGLDVWEEALARPQTAGVAELVAQWKLRADVCRKTKAYTTAGVTALFREADIWERCARDLAALGGEDGKA